MSIKSIFKPRAIAVLGFVLGLYALSTTVWHISMYHFPTPSIRIFDTTALSSTKLDNLGLTEDQCRRKFPGLMGDIDKNVALGPFTLEKYASSGQVVVRIEDGQLHIMKSGRNISQSPELLNSRTATLHQLHRAMLTSPGPLPKTIVAINIEDQPFGTSFSYGRPAYAAPAANLPAITRAFLMPHFAFWAWGLPFFGASSRVADAIERIEADTSFPEKDPRAVWRGTSEYNGIHHPHLRQDLLRATQDAEWADVQALDDYKHLPPEKGSPTKSIMIEDFCRYKYVLHTEGITYSGRFQFLQMCNSIVLTPPLAWMQHTSHLVKPLFSSDLDLHEGGKEISRGASKAWPEHYKPEDANIVFVAEDWSDLQATIEWLEAHAEIAEHIASNQRGLFVQGGYFSQAAETCYWRALIRGWSEVVRIDADEWETEHWTPWEVFSLGQDD